MESLLLTAGQTEKRVSFWKNPIAWLRKENLSRGYWTFFAAAFFYDAGFAVYFFLFNLYLMDRGFSDRVIGLIGGSFTLGSLVGTLPAGALARRTGLRSLLLALFITAPLLNLARSLWIWEPAQIALAFIAGVAMSAWGVCFLPAIARLTSEKNRPAAFSFILSASVGTSILGGVVCGYLRRWLEMAGFAISAAQVKEWILLTACAIVPIGLLAVLRLRFPSDTQGEMRAERAWLHGWQLSPFLRRYLLVMALWCAVLAAFTPFANIYLSRSLHVPMEQVGLAFSLVQVIQLGMVLLVPMVSRMLGLVKGIAAMQAAAAVVLGCMAGVTNPQLAVVLYLIFSAAQWMSTPALYNFLMNETPDAERSTAAAMTLFSNSLAGSVATAGAGILFMKFGYPPVLMGIALAALAIALLFLFLMSPMSRGSMGKKQTEES
jgi:predicted MFS family arabinose efflux permease